MSTPDDSAAPDPAEFLPRPWPRRVPGDSPLRGRRVLVAHRDAARAAAVAEHLAAEGASVVVAGPRPPAAPERWDLLLVDPSLPDLTPLLRGPEAPVVLAFPVPDGAPSALAPEQVFAYLPADLDSQTLRHVLGRALEQRVLADENARLRASLEERFTFGSLVARDPAMRATLGTVESVADTSATLLLLGESGTGKTLLARTVHQRSARADGPFVVVSCGALPPSLLESELFGHVQGAFTGALRDRPGRVEQADGGTLFLDEIQSAPPELQVKLLRLLQERTYERVGESVERHVDARWIVATNRDLEAEIAAGRFREDLYWRIRVVAVELPPLRERPADLRPLAERFLERYAAEHRKAVRELSPDVLSVLAACRWPGNVRQLENALERAVLLSQGPVLVPADLGPELLEEAAEAGAFGPVGGGGGLLEGLANLTRLPPLKEALAGPERAIIARALELTGGSRKRAAEMLDINRTTLFNKMRKYGLLDVPPAGR